MRKKKLKYSAIQTSVSIFMKTSSLMETKLLFCGRRKKKSTKQKNTQKKLKSVRTKLRPKERISSSQGDESWRILNVKTLLAFSTGAPA